MSTKSNILKNRKSKIILNLKKFSNVALFSRKEQEFEKSINSLNKSSKSFINKKSIKNSKLPIPSDDISTYALKTVSTFKNSFNSFSTKILLPKQLMNKTQTEKQFHPYFTITSFRPEGNNSISNNILKRENRNKNKKKHNEKRNIFLLTQSNFKNVSNTMNNDQRLNTISYNFIKKNEKFSLKEKENDIKLLKKIKFIHDRENVDKDEEYLLKLKLEKMYWERFNISVILNKLRDFKYFSYINELKKEVNKNSLENSKNNVDFIKDKINSLNSMKQIYNNTISNKLLEYSKFISNYKDRERRASEILLNQINSIKKQVKNLQNKISKKEFEKVTILKWIYFLIKMKEKKLVLPAYYKKIIETNFQRRKERRKSIAQNIENIKSIQDKHNYFFSHNENIREKDRSNKILKSVRLSTIINENYVKNKFNNFEEKKSPQKSSKKSLKFLDTKNTYSFKKKSVQYNYIFENNNLNTGNIINFSEDNSDINKELKADMDKLIKEGINSSEINRINKYKLHLIYKTPDDLNDRLMEFQNENVLLLKQYEDCRKKLNSTQIKFEQLMNKMITEDYFNLNKKIEEREFELNLLKKKNELLLKQVEDAKKSSKPKKNIINIKNKKSRSQNKKPITQESIRKELLSKIQKLYELCIKNIEVPNKNNDINSDIKSDKNKINKDVIYMLAVIELFVVKLKSKLNVNDKSNILRYELIRKIRNEIDHKHKIEKGQLLRLKEKEKFKNLQEEIEEKTNKILFLRKRKIIPVYNWNNMNKEKRIKFINKVNFEDFMFD